MKLKETDKLREKIEEVNDLSYNLQKEEDEVKRQLEKLEQEIQRNEFNSIEEYRKSQEEVKKLREKLVEIEGDRRTIPIRERDVKQNIIPNVISTYNKEFSPFIETYKKLSSELDKKLDSFAKEIEPIVKEMIEIEKTEQNYHFVTNVTDNKNKVTIPVKRTKLTYRESDNSYSPTKGYIYNFTQELEVLISNIKRKSKR